jgi:hypothetical protein
MGYWGLLLRWRGLGLQRAECGKRRDVDQAFDEAVDQMVSSCWLSASGIVQRRSDVCFRGVKRTFEAKLTTRRGSADRGEYRQAAGAVAQVTRFRRVQALFKPHVVA